MKIYRGGDEQYWIKGRIDGWTQFSCQKETEKIVREGLGSEYGYTGREDEEVGLRVKERKWRESQRGYRTIDKEVKMEQDGRGRQRKWKEMMRVIKRKLEEVRGHDEPYAFTFYSQSEDLFQAYHWSQ